MNDQEDLPKKTEFCEKHLQIKYQLFHMNMKPSHDEKKKIEIGNDNVNGNNFLILIVGYFYQVNEFC